MFVKFGWFPLSFNLKIAKVLEIIIIITYKLLVLERQFVPPQSFPKWKLSPNHHFWWLWWFKGRVTWINPWNKCHMWKENTGITLHETNSSHLKRRHPASQKESSSSNFQTMNFFWCENVRFQEGHLCFCIPIFKFGMWKTLLVLKRSFMYPPGKNHRLKHNLGEDILVHRRVYSWHSDGSFDFYSIFSFMHNLLQLLINMYIYIYIFFFFLNRTPHIFRQEILQESSLPICTFSWSQFTIKRPPIRIRRTTQAVKSIPGRLWF